jgi:hypothetical protein
MSLSNILSTTETQMKLYLFDPFFQDGYKLKFNSVLYSFVVAVKNFYDKPHTVDIHSELKRNLIEIKKQLEVAIEEL